MAKDWHDDDVVVVVVDDDDDGTMRLTVAEASRMRVEDRLQLKNYLMQVLRLLKHLLLYYSRVSNCLTESVALNEWRKRKTRRKMKKLQEQNCKIGRQIKKIAEFSEE